VGNSSGLRHYYASLLIRNDASVRAVQPRLGHSSTKTTLDIYAHLWPDKENRTRRIVDAEF
jgi:integrase